MNYTTKEYNLISNAMTDASNYLDVAYNNLYLFHEQYFEGGGDHKYLAAELEHRPEMIATQIYGIILALHEAKIELDVFTNPQSNQLRARLSNARDMENTVQITR